MEQKIVGITDHADLVKDLSCSAVLATDKTQFEQHLLKRKKMESMEKRMDVIENKLDHTLSILEKLVSKLS